MSSLLSTEGSAGICCSPPTSNAAPRLQEVKQSPQNLVRAAPLVAYFVTLFFFFLEETDIFKGLAVKQHLMHKGNL